MSCNCCYEHKSGFACACHTYENYTARKIIGIVRGEYETIMEENAGGSFHTGFSREILERLIRAIETTIHPDTYDKYKPRMGTPSVVSEELP